MLEVTEIKRLIDNDAASEKKRIAGVGVRYYEAEHDILKYRMFYFNADGQLVEDTLRTNMKVSHPFFTELADQFTAYLLSNAEEALTVENELLKPLITPYFDEEFWAECVDLVTGAYVKGFDYLYGYKGENNRLKFEYADSMGVVEKRERNTDKNCACYIYHYVERIEDGKKEVIRIEVHTDKDITFYVQDGKSGAIELDKDIKPNPRPNVIYSDEESGEKYGGSLGFVPFFRLDYNRKQISGLKPIKGLIDDYDLMQCGLTNNIQDFDTPIHVVNGFQGDNLDELQKNIKTKKLLGIPETGGGLDIKTVDIPYEARKTKADEDEKNIYRFGMGLNTNGLKDTSATTNLAIQAAYSLLDLKTSKFLPRFKAFLKQIVKVVIDEINEQNGTAYTADEVKFDFVPSTPINESEAAATEKTKAETEQIRLNNILTVAAQIGDEEVLKAICDILDLDFDELKKNIEDINGTEAAQSVLNAVEPIEGNELPPEPVKGQEGGTEPQKGGDLIAT